MSKAPVGVNVLVLGATSAIAQAVTRIYATRGSSFYLVARNPERLALAAADARVRGAAEVQTRALDLNDTTKHGSLLEDAAQKFPKLDLIIIAYGILGDQVEGERNFTETEEVLRTNFVSVVSLLTRVANDFEQRRAGIIVAISSVAGDRGRKSNYIYGASKAALSVFLEGLRARLEPHGVRVLTIKPGFVATPMTAHLKHNFLFASPDQIARGIVQAIDGHKGIAYLPWFWGPIMCLIRAVPERIFKKLNL